MFGVTWFNAFFLGFFSHRPFSAIAFCVYSGIHRSTPLPEFRVDKTSFRTQCKWLRFSYAFDSVPDYNRLCFRHTTPRTVAGLFLQQHLARNRGSIFGYCLSLYNMRHTQRICPHHPDAWLFPRGACGHPFLVSFPAGNQGNTMPVGRLETLCHTACRRDPQAWIFL